MGGHICKICGNKLNQPGTLCNDCKEKRPIFEKMRSWGQFGGPLRPAIHQLKYQGNISLGDELSTPMLQLLKDLEWEVDMVVPVPLSASRYKKRGYNQAALLAADALVKAGAKKVYGLTLARTRLADHYFI